MFIIDSLACLEDLDDGHVVIQNSGRQSPRQPHEQGPSQKTNSYTKGVIRPRLYGPRIARHVTDTPQRCT